MTEREMEDLVAAYPEEFFPRKTMKLRGRQGSFAGVGRFDLLFEDEHHTNVLMELKAVPAKYDHASQLAKYRAALERSGERNVLMWLVAPLIPKPVRDFLDQIGIEYTEIHEAEYKAVAQRHDVALEGEGQKHAVVSPRPSTSSCTESPIGDDSIVVDESTMKSYQLFKEQKNRFVEELFRVDKDVVFPLNWKELNRSDIRRRKNWFIAFVPNSWVLFEGGFCNVHFSFMYRRDPKTGIDYVRLPVGVEGSLGSRADEFKKDVVVSLRQRGINLPGCALWPDVGFGGKKLIEPSLVMLDDDSWKKVLTAYLTLGEFIQVVADMIRQYSKRQS